jgi:short-subunit dehydrogenase
MKTETALITGCTSGIGLHLAHQFAKNGHPVVLVAPVEEELQQLRAELTSVYGVDAFIIAKDLEKEDAAQEIFNTLQDHGITIDILANNAGHGFHGNSWEIPIEKDLSIVRLNIEAPLRLTKLLLPPMVSRGSGRILNTASVAGFEPGPLVAVYHASKAFVLSWTEAMAVELKETGVKVTALCPGPTDTDFFPKAGMTEIVGFQKGAVMAPQEVAKAGYEGLMNEDLIVVPGVVNKLLVMGRRVLTEEAQAKLNKKQYEEVPADEHKRNRGDFENKAATNA